MPMRLIYSWEPGGGGVVFVTRVRRRLGAIFDAAYLAPGTRALQAGLTLRCNQFELRFLG